MSTIDVFKNNEMFSSLVSLDTEIVLTESIWIKAKDSSIFTNYFCNGFKPSFFRCSFQYSSLPSTLAFCNLSSLVEIENFG